MMAHLQPVIDLEQETHPPPQQDHISIHSHEDSRSQVNPLSVSNASAASNVSNVSLDVVSQGVSKGCKHTLMELLAYQYQENNKLAQSAVVAPANPNPQPPKPSPSQVLVGSAVSGPPSSGRRFLQPEEYLPKRIKRMNIPQTTIIDRKTGEAIHTTYPCLPGFGPGLHPSLPERTGREHEEDRNIVAKLNRMIVEGGWKYSSLLGADNHDSKVSEKEFNSTERDAEFPQVWAVVTPQMARNFKLHGGETVAHLIKCPETIKIVQSCDGYGLTPTNSRYFAYGVFGMTRGLEPTLFALGFTRDRTKDRHLHLVYYGILKTLIRAHNPKLTERREEMEVRRAMSRRRGREVEEIEEESYVFPQLLFGKAEQEMKDACAKIREQFGVRFELIPHFEDRFSTMRFRFVRHQIKTDKPLLARCDQLIRRMLETNCHKELQDCIDKLTEHNRDFSRRFRVYELGRLCLVNWDKRWVGFHPYERYELAMRDYLEAQVTTKGGHTLKQFLNNIVQQEGVELSKPIKPPVDRYGLMTYNTRLKRLLFVVEPSVIGELLELYRVGEGLKCEKDRESPVERYVVGAGKMKRKTMVEFLHRVWKCECGYQPKVGIPCPHLFRVLHTEKTTKYQDYISFHLKKVRLEGCVEID